MKSLTVISTTYDKEKPENLDECLNSVFNQSINPDKVILVGDGKLTNDLYKVIDKFKKSFPDLFVYAETDENKGNWYASNLAIDLCNTDIICKIDSDDILCSEYVECISEAFDKENIDVCGVYIDEFDNDTKRSLNIKMTPLLCDDIYKYARRRNPFNNPGIAFSRELAIKVGKYSEMPRCEDYDFVVKLLLAGAKAINLDKVLVRYRTSEDNLTRRRNYQNTKWFIKCRRKIYKSGFSSFLDYFITSAIQIVLFVMPVQFTKIFYNKLRK